MVKIFKEKTKYTLVFSDAPSSTQDFIIGLIELKYADGVRVYREYDKITITFYDGSDATYNFISELISDCYGGRDIRFTEVEGLVPVELKVDTIEIIGSASKKSTNDAVLTDGFKYAGLTCRESLLKHGDDALIDMCKVDLSDNINVQLISAIRHNCENYVKNAYGKLSDEDIFNTPKDKMIDFIQKFQFLLKTKIDDILSRSAFGSLDDLLNNADNLVLGSAYSALTKELIIKFK